MNTGIAAAGIAVLMTATGASAIEVHQAAPVKIAEPPPPIRVFEAPPMKPQGAPGSKSPEKANALAAEGNALLKQGRHQEAAHAYTRSLEANPNQDSVWNNRGLAHAKSNPPNLEQAWKDFSQAIQLNPNNDRAYLNRALVNKQIGQEQNHLNDLAMAAQLGNDKAKGLLKAARPGGQVAEASPAASPSRPSPRSNGNPIEPISNGIAMNMTRDEVKQRFGDPGRRAGFPSCVMHFADFTAETCGQDKRVSRLYLSGPGVKLGSGLGVGSSKADVTRLLGNPSGGQQGPYKLGVAYNGDRVSSIKIDYEPAPRGEPGNRSPSANYCAPNCGFDYSTGQAAPTIYNPNSNYSPFGH